MAGVRHIALGLIATAAGVAVAVLLAEVLLRALGISSEIAYQPDSRYGWGHSPSSSYSRRIDGNEIHVETNSAGLRDREYEYEKPPGAYRALVLGDSFIEGLQVAIEETFSRQLEGILNVSGHADAVQVINGGVSGYGTDNEYLYFVNEGVRFGADLIILSLYVGNDIRNNWYELENRDVGGFRKPYFVPDGDGLQLKPNPNDTSGRLGTRVRLFFNRNSRLYAYARRVRDNFVATSAIAEAGLPLDWHLFDTQAGQEWRTAMIVTKRLISKLQSAASESDAELLVILVPTQFQVHEQYFTHVAGANWDLDLPNRELAAFLDEESIGYIDLTTSLRQAAHDSGEELYLTSDAHWNGRGHRAAAEAVAARILVDRKQAAQ